jgi:hypothetical protein
MTVMRGVLLGIALVLAMVVASVRAEPDRWPGVVRWASVQAALARGEVPPCPVLAEFPLAGEREQGYADAIRLLRTCDRGWGERLQALATERAAWPLRTDDRDCLLAMGPALDTLRTTVRGPCTGSLAIRDGELLLDAVRALVVLARERNSTAEATVAIAVARDQFAQVDLLARLCGSLGLELVAAGLDERWLAAGSSEDLTAFAVAIAQADPARLPCLAPAATCAGIVDHLAGASDIDPAVLGMRSPLAAWRHGFSLRRAGMDRALALAADVQRFDVGTPAGETWPDRRVRLQELVDREAAASGNAWMSWYAGLVEHEVAARRGVAALRLLRVAVAARLEQPLPELGDPFGSGPLRIERGPDGGFATSASEPPMRRKLPR